jgi:hypothetical protein
MLIEAVEEVARTDSTVLACERPVPPGLSLQLARPSSTFPVAAPHFILRN